MKYNYLILLGLIILLLQTPLQAQHYRTTAEVNMRKGPGTTHPVITSVSPKDQLTLISQENEGWWKVKYEGKTGYISAKYLEEVKDPKSNAERSHQTSNDQKTKSSNNTKSNSASSSSSRNQSKAQSNSSGKSNTYRWGIGLRLGDPTGLSVKRFLGHNALEFNVGRTAWSYSPERRFRNYDDFDNYEYLEGRLRSALSFQLHYLKFMDINADGFAGLQWYYGFGGQIRAMTADYYYQYRVYHGPGGGDYHWERRWEKATDLDFGVDGVIGLDYSFPKAPVSVFTDMTLFTEIVDDPFRFRLQGGVGVRYNF